MPVPEGEELSGTMSAQTDLQLGEIDIGTAPGDESLVSEGTVYLSAKGDSTIETTDRDNTFNTAYDGMTSLESAPEYSPEHYAGKDVFHEFHDVDEDDSEDDSEDDDDDDDDEVTPRESFSENGAGYRGGPLPESLRMSFHGNERHSDSEPKKRKGPPEMRGAVALDEVCAKLDSIDGTDREKDFLRNVMEDNVIQSMMKAHDTLESGEDLQPVRSDNIQLVKDVLNDLDDVKEPDARELAKILNDTNFKALVETHDDIANKNFDPSAHLFSADHVDADEPAPATPPEAIRMVGIRKTADEPLGITVHCENHNLSVARIFPGSFIEKQGLLHVGDVIQEVNGMRVHTPEQLQHVMKQADGSITLKIIPSYADDQAVEQVYVKAHFNFDPSRDNLIPSKEAGLAFREGDILQILNRKDKNWWQAMRVDDETRAGLIPSQEMEEKRKAFVRPDYDYTKSSLLCGMSKKKKKKQMFTAKDSEALDRADIHIYEEVARLPPFQRKTLVLIGAPGVGRRSLKNLLLEHSPRTFGNVLPYTSRTQREGEYGGFAYHFASREEMEQDIHEGGYLEYGEFQSNLYGIRLESLRHIIMDGKIPVLDCSPQAIKAVKTAEFMPFVIFVAAPSVEILRNMYELGKMEGWTTKTYTERDFIRTVEESAKIERAYRQLFDTIIVNDNMDETYRTLIDHYEAMSTEDQWVPISWVY